MQISQHKTGFTRTLEASSVSSRSERGFTTTSEGENEGLPSFFPSAVGAKARSAFTLIELLVVIAIIGILSSVVLASLSGARESAKVTKMASDLEQIETGLVMWMDATGQVKWPMESEVTCSGSCSVSSLADNSKLGNYLTAVPEPPLGNSPYRYEHDGQSYSDSCSGETYPQITIYVNGLQNDVAKKVDKIIDGESNLSCGRFYERSGNYFYLLSKNDTL